LDKVKSVSQCKEAAGVWWLPFWLRAFESVHRPAVEHYNPHMETPLCILESNPALIVCKHAEDASWVQFYHSREYVFYFFMYQ